MYSNVFSLSLLNKRLVFLINTNIREEKLKFRTINFCNKKLNPLKCAYVIIPNKNKAK
jgi:hypothetical protein